LATAYRLLTDTTRGVCLPLIVGGGKSPSTSPSTFPFLPNSLSYLLLSSPSSLLSLPSARSPASGAFRDWPVPPAFGGFLIPKKIAFDHLYSPKW